MSRLHLLGSGGLLGNGGLLGTAGCWATAKSVKQGRTARQIDPPIKFFLRN